MLNHMKNFVTAHTFFQGSYKTATSPQQAIITSEMPTELQNSEPDLSTEMTRVKAPYNKYSAIMNTHNSFNP